MKKMWIGIISVIVVIIILAVYLFSSDSIKNENIVEKYPELAGFEFEAPPEDYDVSIGDKFLFDYEKNTVSCDGIPAELILYQSESQSKISDLKGIVGLGYEVNIIDCGINYYIYTFSSSFGPLFYGPYSI